MKLNPPTFFFATTLALFAFGLKASMNAHEARPVYHSQCEVSVNPVRYEGHSGTVSVRKWWYRDTITGQKVATTKAQHRACESVKVLMSTPAEVAEAERLEQVHHNWLIACFSWMFLWVGALFLHDRYLSWRDGRDRLNAEREREIERQQVIEERAIQRKIKESERVRSKRANEERARRKAERGAILEARRLANLAKRNS